MTEIVQSVNRNISIVCEEFSAKMKKIHEVGKTPLPVQERSYSEG